MDAGERKCLEDIERYGCHVIHVLAEAELPPFAYSVGIARQTGAAEAIVIGLKKPRVSEHIPHLALGFRRVGLVSLLAAALG